MHVSNRSVGRVFSLFHILMDYTYIYICVCVRVCLFTVFSSVDTTNLCCLASKPGVPFFRQAWIPRIVRDDPPSKPQEKVPIVAVVPSGYLT